MSTPPPLSDVFGSPRWFGLDEEFWTAVGVIAWLRMWANDLFRGATRTRGEDKNWLNDAQGAFGELLAIRRSEGLSEARVTAQDLVDFDGPVDDVDLTLEAAGATYRIEAKGLLWDPSKKRFLINEIARERSDRRGAHGYMLSFGEFGGPRAVVGRVVSMESVQRWETFEGPYGDPARTIPLADLSPLILHQPWVAVSRSIRRDDPQPTREQTIQSTKEASFALARRWQDRRSGFPSTSELCVREIVDRLCDPA